MINKMKELLNKKNLFKEPEWSNIRNQSSTKSSELKVDNYIPILDKDGNIKGYMKAIDALKYFPEQNKKNKVNKISVILYIIIFILAAIYIGYKDSELHLAKISTEKGQELKKVDEKILKLKLDEKSERIKIHPFHKDNIGIVNYHNISLSKNKIIYDATSNEKKQLSNSILVKAIEKDDAKVYFQLNKNWYYINRNEF